VDVCRTTQVRMRSIERGSFFVNGLSEVSPDAATLTDGDRTPVTGAVDDGLEAWALCKGSAGVADLDISHALSERGNIQIGFVILIIPLSKDKIGRKKSGICQISSDAPIGLESMQKATFSDARRSAVSRWRETKLKQDGPCRWSGHRVIG
jgi:hypothetical protein